MIRNFTSIALTLAIVVALAGSTCMACWMPVTKAATGCCQQQGSCHKSSKPATGHAHSACSAPAPVDLASVEKPVDLQILFPPPVVVANNGQVIPPSPMTSAAIDRSDSYYPPELCLLNSVLLI